jgi:hypothetical protein
MKQGGKTQFVLLAIHMTPSVSFVADGTKFWMYI